MTERTLEIIRELSGTTCHCGATKEKNQTFCKRCYFALEPGQRRALYRRVGNGYEQAYDAAVEALESHGCG